MKELIIVGGGGFAKEVIWLAQDCGYTVKGILDDNTNTHGTKILNVEVLGAISNCQDYADTEFIIAIGSPRTRHAVVQKMQTLCSLKFATLIHPEVKCSKYIKVGDGSIICAGCIMTVDITIGKHCIINLQSTIGHECFLGDFVTIAPLVAISGNVALHDFAELGTHACIRQGLEIAQGAMLGMGGVLTKNMPKNAIFVGNPAKLLKLLPSIKADYA
jgi:sugar O-acyltransferase (sialic acid O-acetyltransferase NeuD family)